MTTAALAVPRIQVSVLVLAGVAAAALLLALLLNFGGEQAALLVIGLGLGVSLYHAAFGLFAAYRRVIFERDISDVAAQAVMLAVFNWLTLVVAGIRGP